MNQRLRRNDHDYVVKRNALFAKAKRNGLACWICKKPIDYELPWKHPMAFTADHVEPVAAGGSMTGDLMPAHRSCNSRRGVGRPVTVMQPLKVSPLVVEFGGGGPPSR